MRAVLDGEVQLARGSEDRAGVRELQRLLNRLLFLIEEDGAFGTKTERAIRVIQASRGVPVDGVVDAGTLSAMLAAVDSISEKIISAEFKSTPNSANSVEPAPGIYRHDKFPGRVALTFDDGPSPVHTPSVLRILARAGLRATFYVQGSCAVDSPALVREAAELGHRIGNHSWSHSDFTSLGSESAVDEILRTQELLQQIAGPSYTHTVRPPYGSPFHSSALPYSRFWSPIGDVISRACCRLMMWQTDTWDWRHFTRPEIVVETFKRELGESGGGVVLMHDVHEQTVEALPGVLDVIRQHRMPVVSDQELLTQKYAQGKRP
jgi:peptidoglycan/xylan/chitin deacetylase (PgdA/CDA1 family)